MSRLSKSAGCSSWLLPLPAGLGPSPTKELFHEPREYSRAQSQRAPRLSGRQFLCAFTCQYCRSHHGIIIIFLAITRYKLLY